MILLLILSCQNSKRSELEKENDVFEQSFSDYKELAILKDYQKVTDTSYIKNGMEPTHRITHFRKNEKNLILLSSITFDDNYQEVLLPLDTLKIPNLEQDTYITIGYCEMSNMLPEEIIAIVEKTDRDTIQKVMRAWKADYSKSEIEEIQDIEDIICLNQG
ncbi:hypothetical protein G3I01_16025 [Gramella sp. MT6]|nr:hypothetical protein G3I01_16025 [Gramella sp. MT6]